MPDRRARPREHDTSHADTAGGTLERHPELPGNTVSCELPGPFALVSGDAMDGGDATARQSTAGKRRLWPVPWGSWADNTARELQQLSLIHISEPTRLGMISYAVFCLK